MPFLTPGRLLMGGRQSAYAFLLSTINPDHWWKLDETAKTHGVSVIDAVGALNLTYSITAPALPDSSISGLHDGRTNGAALLLAAFSTDNTITGGVPWASNLDAFTVGFTYKWVSADASANRTLVMANGSPPTDGVFTFNSHPAAGTISVSFYTWTGAAQGTLLTFTCNTFVFTINTLYDFVFAWDASAGNATDAYFVVNGTEYSCTLDVGTYTETQFHKPTDFRIARGVGANDGPTNSDYDDVWTCSRKVPAADAITYHSKLLELPL